MSRHVSSPQTAVAPVHRHLFDSPFSKSWVPPNWPPFQRKFTVAEHVFVALCSV